MKCFVCQHAGFEKVFSKKKLEVFSALRREPFSEKFRFDAALYRCMQCGFVQQKLSPSLKRFLTAFYKEEASFFSAPPSLNTPNARMVRTISFLSKYVQKPPKNVLEIGAYDGYFLDLVRKKFKAKETVGIEISKRKNIFPRIQMIHDEYPTKKVAGKKFDLIIAMNVLEHMFAPREFMEAARENLSEEGKVLIEIPNEEWTFATGMLSYQHQHISYFTPTTIKRFLTSVGFTLLGTYTKDTDRILLLCKKTHQAVEMKHTVDMSSRGYEKRSQAMLKKFKKYIASTKPAGLYGASTFTHNILHVTGVEKKAIVFDGDARKVGKYMSGVTEAVRPWSDIDSSGLSRVVIMPLGFTKEIYAFLLSKKIKTPIRKMFEKI